MGQRYRAVAPWGAAAVAVGHNEEERGQRQRTGALVANCEAAGGKDWVGHDDSTNQGRDAGCRRAKRGSTWAVYSLLSAKQTVRIS